MAIPVIERRKLFSLCPSLASVHVFLFCPVMGLLIQRCVCAFNVIPVSMTRLAATNYSSLRSIQPKKNRQPFLLPSFVQRSAVVSISISIISSEQQASPIAIVVEGLAESSREMMSNPPLQF
jgi:hypothetical protein